MFKNIANIDSFLNDGDYSTNVIPGEEELEEVSNVVPVKKTAKVKLISMLLLTAIIGTVAGIGFSFSIGHIIA